MTFRFAKIQVFILHQGKIYFLHSRCFAKFYHSCTQKIMHTFSQLSTQLFYFFIYLCMAVCTAVRVHIFYKPQQQDCRNFQRNFLKFYFWRYQSQIFRYCGIFYAKKRDSFTKILKFFLQNDLGLNNFDIQYTECLRVKIYILQCYIHIRVYLQIFF